jgi:hypothetical protein
MDFGVFLSAQAAFRIDRKSPLIQPLRVASCISIHFINTKYQHLKQTKKEELLAAKEINDLTTKFSDIWTVLKLTLHITRMV